MTRQTIETGMEVWCYAKNLAYEFAFKASRFGLDLAETNSILLANARFVVEEEGKVRARGGNRNVHAFVVGELVAHDEDLAIAEICKGWQPLHYNAHSPLGFCLEGTEEEAPTQQEAAILYDRRLWIPTAPVSWQLISHLLQNTSTD